MVIALDHRKFYVCITSHAKLHFLASENFGPSYYTPSVSIEVLTLSIICCYIHNI